LTSAYSLSLSLHTGKLRQLGIINNGGGVETDPQVIPGHLVWGVEQTTGGGGSTPQPPGNSNTAVGSLWIFIKLYCFIPRQVPTSFAGGHFMIVLAYVNVVLNAAIYARHLDVITRCWRAFRNLHNNIIQVGATVTHSKSSSRV
jgi:hypothetical protein